MEIGADGKKRCFGNAPGQAFYAEYHDTEWGVPERNARKLFEMLILEGAQAGVSWLTILKKREGYRRAFHDFEPEVVAAMPDAQLEALLQDPGIIRNRLKVFSARKNAQAFLAIQAEFGTFADYLWGWVDGKPIINDWQSLAEVPADTPLSKALSKDLKKRGVSFFGPVVAYAYMQAVGLVDDHVAGCWLYERNRGAGA